MKFRSREKLRCTSDGTKCHAGGFFVVGGIESSGMQVESPYFDRFMQQVSDALTTHRLVGWWIDRRKWGWTYYVAELLPESRGEYAEILGRLDEIKQLVARARKPGRFGNYAPISERVSEMTQVDILKYSIELPAVVDGADTVVSRKLNISLAGGDSPTLEDVGLPTSVDVALDAVAVEFETIQDRVTVLSLTDTDDDGGEGTSESFSFTAIDEIGPDVNAFGSLSAVSERSVVIDDEPAPSPEPEPETETETETETEPATAPEPESEEPPIAE